jgi:hypothetical protein
MQVMGTVAASPRNRSNPLVDLSLHFRAGVDGPDGRRRWVTTVRLKRRVLANENTTTDVRTARTAI